MASSSHVTSPWLDQSEEQRQRVFYRRLGLLNGLALGLAIVLGVWGPQLAALSGIPAASAYASVIVAATLIFLLAGLIGWLTARIARGWITFLLWLATAAVIVVIIGYQPNQLRTLAIWLSDRRFWGLPIYPFLGGSVVALILAGFLMLLTLATLAILQDYRLEGIYSSLKSQKRPGCVTWFLLLLPLPLVVLAAYVTGNIVSGSYSSRTLWLVNEVIQTGRTYEGDLFALSRAEGINYDAIHGVRDQLEGNYTLFIGSVELETATTFVVVHFDSGSWINCRVVNEQLSFCYDASLPYTIGLASLISGEPVPEDCRGCVPRVSDEWRAWLQERGGRFAGPPQVRRVTQQDSYVLMEAASTTGDYKLFCWFNGLTVVRIESCGE
ncbi:MAG: hypothetical protein L0332_11065 [Chloroflexi bacterium]|nr:hypothetical protein [Chloroflexota bacterium]MCI0578272.1 hypothetical protein [Chloroflexota bacterium]MCI0648779.1 hypothetical protein [Chloroflexota bacterium]MCI0727247.1 hypothetical protein [Chloroflexota bacterium]